jgi:hypothetical protein
MGSVFRASYIPEILKLVLLARWWGSVPAQNAFEERLLSLMAKQ